MMRKTCSAKQSAGVVALLALVISLFGPGLSQSAAAAPTSTDQPKSDVAAAPPSLFVAYTPPFAKDAAVIREAQVVRSQTVSINLPLLAGSAGASATLPIQGQSVALNLFEDVSFIADPDQVTANQNGLTWIGKLRGVEMSQVVIVVTGNVVAGNISMPSGRYHIRYVGNSVHEVQQIDQSTFPPDERAVPIPEQGLTTAPVQDPNAARDDGSIIDVMVVYTATTRAAAGGTAAIQSQIDLAFAETNQAYLSSGVNQRLRQVHSEEVVYNEATADPLGDALNCISSTTDGCLDNIHTLRNTYGADLVSIWLENGGGYCGIAWLMTSVSTSFAVNGFSSVARSCATGYYSFGHELGHNMGLNHDTYVAPGTLPYAYAHGFTNTTAASPWRTTMAYNDACAAVGKNCTRLQYFSNPAITYGGATMGNAATADNHLALNNTAFTVANFRTSISTCTYTLGTSSASFSASGGMGSVALTTGSTCAWTAVSNAAWITVTSGTSGTGSITTIAYSVAANTSTSARSGTITIGGQTFTVSQAAAAATCSYALSPSSYSSTAGGALLSFSVITTTGCAWTAASNASWISISIGAAGSGSGTVTLLIAANTSPSARSGTVTAAGQTFTVTQDAACSYSISPSNQTLGSASATGSVLVTAGTGCAWSASSNASWLSISSGSSGSGNGSVFYVAAANSTGASRTGSLTVAGNSFSVTQGTGASVGTVHNALFVNASTSPTKTTVLRLINTSSGTGAVSATAYNEAGSVVGTANVVIGSPASQQMLTFTSAQLEAALGYTPSSSTAKYRIVFSANLANYEIINFIKDSATANLTLGQAQVDNRAASSATTSTRHALFVNPSTSTNKTSVLRLINLSGSSGSISATAYNEAGTQLGLAGSAVGTLGSQQMLSLTSAQLESAIGFVPSSPTSKYRIVFSGNLNSFEVVNFIKDVATGNLTLGQDQID
jgi:hypothetical protein